MDVRERQKAKVSWGTRVCGADNPPPLALLLILWDASELEAWVCLPAKHENSGQGCAENVAGDCPGHGRCSRNGHHCDEGGKSPCWVCLLTRLGTGVWCHPATRVFSHEKEQISGTLHCGRTWKRQAGRRKPVAQAVWPHRG